MFLRGRVNCTESKRGMHMSFIIGLLAGGFGGFLGVGGGVIMVPLMVHSFRMIQREAHGTSLVALIMTGVVGTATYGMSDAVDYPGAVVLAVSAMGMARVGALCCHRMSEWRLKKAFGLFMLVALALLLAKPYIPTAAVPIAGWAKIGVLAAIGIVTGFASGLLGVGGGMVMIPGMVLLAGMSQITAQGSSLLCMVPVGAVGAYTHWRLGNVRRDILPGLLIGILIGALVGGNFAQYMPESVLRIVFSGLLLWTGIRFLKAKPEEAPVCESDVTSM